MKLCTETSKLQAETSKIFQIFLETFILEFGYFSNLVLLLGSQSKSQSLSKESFKEDPKNFMTGVSKFQF